jgi:hypothetical protein
MTHQDWIPEAPRRSWLSRLLAPEADAKPSTDAFAVAVLAAGAFVASLTMTWQSATVALSANGADQARATLTYTNTVTSPDMLGLVYALGMLALLALAGAVVTRSDLALRMRLAAAGLTVGLLGVVSAITMTLPDAVYNRVGPFGLADGVKVAVSYEPGLLCAYAAVVLPIVAIWLAARPALREAEARGRTGSDEGRHAALAPVVPRAMAAPLGWDGTDAEPLDLTVTPER